MSQALPEIPGYHVETEIGRGGMGVVYRARRTTDGRALALKMLIRRAWQASEPELARFRIEAEALGCLNHPNIVKIRDIGVARGVPYFAMPYAEGGSLAARVSTPSRTPIESAALVAVIARAIQHAHDRGMLHRDLKPSNVLLRGDGQPVVSDFGLVKFRKPRDEVMSASTMSADAFDELGSYGTELEAQFKSAAPRFGDRPLIEAMAADRARTTGLPVAEPERLGELRRFVEEATAHRDDAAELERTLTQPDRAQSPRLLDLTQDGAIMGSPQYMAPEQAAGDLHRIGPATDVYALGGILYELLTGRRPFEAPSRWEILRRVLADSAAPPRALVPDLSADIESICLICLAKRPEDRYATAAELADDLDRFARGFGPRRFPTESAGSPANRPGPLPTTASLPLTTEPAPTQSWWPFNRAGRRAAH